MHFFYWTPPSFGQVDDDFEAAVQPYREERLPLKAGEFIDIPVSIFGEAVTMVLDTGAEVDIIDETFRDRLEPNPEKISLRTAARNQESELFPSPAMKIGLKNPQPFRSLNGIVCVDLANVSRASGYEVRGVIGMPYLCHRVLTLNFDEGFASIQNPPALRAGHKLKIIFEKGQPYLALQVSDTGAHKILIDTGSTQGISLDYSLFDRLVERKRIVLRGVNELAVFGTDIKRRFGVLDRVSLGPFGFTNVRVDETRGSHIGLDFLSRFLVEFDFPNDRAYFQPGQQLRQPQKWNLAGISLERVDNQTRIREIMPKSSAANAGLIKGDQLLKVNGTEISEMPLGQIRQWFYRPDSDLHLELKRNETPFSVTLKLIAEPDPFPALSVME